MGSGGSTTYYYAGYSGQNGGRVMPGQSYRNVKGGMPEIYLNPLPTAEGYYTSTLYRYNVFLFTGGRGVSGGGAGETGYSSKYFTEAEAWSQEPVPSGIAAANGYYSYGGQGGGGGGGWGAKGGDSYYNIPNSIAPVFGGAGGKAVQTNGYAVTWLGGSDRAYGAVG